MCESLRASACGASTKLLSASAPPGSGAASIERRQPAPMHWSRFIGRGIDILAEGCTKCRLVARGDLDRIDQRRPQIAVAGLQQIRQRTDFRLQAARPCAAPRHGPGGHRLRPGGPRAPQLPPRSPPSRSEAGHRNRGFDGGREPRARRSRRCPSRRASAWCLASVSSASRCKPGDALALLLDAARSAHCAAR